MHVTATPTVLAVRNILLATDFSACSERALLHAVAAARHFGSTLHLLHVVNPATFSLVPPEAYPGCVEAANHVANLARADAEALLNKVLLRTQSEGLKKQVWVEKGAVGDVLRAIIQREHIDLVVAGTRGRTGLRKIVLGSVAEEIFRQAFCPVLTVGPYSWQSDPQAVRLKHILFPTNFSQGSARALPFAFAMASEFDAALTILNVIESLDGKGAQDRTALMARSEERMREMVAAAEPLPTKAEFQVELGNVAERVVEIATRIPTDLIIAGLNPPDASTDKLRWLHAYNIVCNAACPVLTLRGPRYRSR